MRRCLWLPFLLALAWGGLAQTSAPETLRGKLVQPAGHPPAIETSDHHTVAVDGDAPTLEFLLCYRLRDVHAHFALVDRPVAARRNAG